MHADGRGRYVDLRLTSRQHLCADMCTGMRIDTGIGVRVDKTRVQTSCMAGVCMRAGMQWARAALLLESSPPMRPPLRTRHVCARANGHAVGEADLEPMAGAIVQKKNFSPAAGILCMDMCGDMQREV